MKQVSPNFFDNNNILSTIAKECTRYDQRQYNKYVMGKIGSDLEEDEKKYGEILATIKTCVEFEKKHEKDHFKMDIDIQYNDDTAYPDHQMHTVWQYSQKYDNQKNQYDIVRAQNALRATPRARCAGA